MLRSWTLNVAIQADRFLFLHPTQILVWRRLVLKDVLDWRMRLAPGHPHPATALGTIL